jgi:hypothetical protein
MTLGIKMKLYILLIIILFPTLLFADANKSCNIVKTAKVAFTQSEPTDLLELSYSGATCKSADLKLAIYTADGSKIYSYTYDYKQGFYEYENPNYQSDVESYMKKMLGFLMDSTSSLPERAQCSDKETECQKGYFPNRDIEYESPLSLEAYNKLRSHPVSSIAHGVGREAWVTLVFDKASGKVIEVLLSYV